MSRAKFFRKVFTGDRQQDAVQTNVEAAVAQMLRSVIADGILLTGIELETGDNNVSHKLNRPVRGYIVVTKTANANIYDKLVTQIASEKNIWLPLNSSAPTTVSLWIF